MFTPRTAALGLLCPLALITACAQAPTVTPTPAPIIRCTPEAGGAEYDCSQAQHDEMVAKDRLYAEAEAVFRRAFAENIRISRAGGSPEATPVMLETAAGDFLDGLRSEYARLVAEQLRAKGRDPKIVSVMRLPGKSKGGSVVALRVCVDASDWSFYRDGKAISHGFPAADDIYFATLDGRIRMIGADGRKVERCN